MKILIAPDKFKGSLSAAEVCSAIAKGIQKQSTHVDCNLHPIADGGDGSLAIISNHLKTTPCTVNTIDPLGRPMKAEYLIADQTAYLELASASGIVLLKDSERNPLYTSTEGTGVLIKDALSKKLRDINLFAGGSATNDAGLGIAHALGFRFYDQHKKELRPIGANLIKLDYIDKPKNLEKINLKIWSDVTNSLFGLQGAAHTYARQKGADTAAIELLDKGLINFSKVVKKQFGISVDKIKGGGCAGGIGAGMVGLLEAKIENGFDALSKLTDLDEKIKEADLVITGEGRLDTQTLQGKVVGGVSAICEKYNKTLIAFAGINELSLKETKKLRLKEVYSITSKGANQEDAMENANKYLELLAFEMASDWLK